MAPNQELSPSIVKSEESVKSREELLKRERQEKVASPFKLSRAEKLLRSFETKGFRESLGLRFGDFYFSPGGITTGAGASATARYFKANIKDHPIDFSVSAGYSFKQYQLYTFQLGNILRKSPDLFLRGAGSGGLSLFDKTKGREGNFFLYGEISYRDYTEEDFYGLGTNSSEDDQSDYRISGFSYEAVSALRFSRHFGAFVRAGLLEPELRPGLDSAVPPTQDIFTPITAPGLDVQPNFFRFATQFFYDYRDFPGNPTSGGLVDATYGQYFDLDGDQFNFHRLTFDVRQYIPLWSEQRILALRFYTSSDVAPDDSQVPFYLMQTLGGSDSLRGYPNFRFRDKKLYLISAEYRWFPAPAVALVLFYDAGKVFPDASDFNFTDMKSDYGFGIRLLAEEKVQVRFDVGHSVEGTQFFLKLNTSF